MGNNKVLLLICDDFYKPSCRLSWMRNGYYETLIDFYYGFILIKIYKI